MPKVLAEGKTIDCFPVGNLRKILLQNGIYLYNHGAKVINCQVIGSCATYTVKVEDKLSAANWRDQARPSPRVRLSAFASSLFSDNRLT